MAAHPARTGGRSEPAHNRSTSTPPAMSEATVCGRFAHRSGPDRGGARLFEPSDLDPALPALGRSSAAALRSGVVHGLAGAVVGLVAAVEAETDLAGAPVWLTGGAADLVAPALARALGERLRREPDLVLEGLAAAAREHLRGTGA